MVGDNKVGNGGRDDSRGPSLKEDEEASTDGGVIVLRSDTRVLSGLRGTRPVNCGFGKDVGGRRREREKREEKKGKEREFMGEREKEEDYRDGGKEGKRSASFGRK